MHFKIIYTSDVHGQILATDYGKNKKSAMGLSRLKTYLQSLKDNYLLLDNGDFLQGSVMLDYQRKFAEELPHPARTAYHHLGYDLINLGNHDFNYGFDYLKKVMAGLEEKVLCANIMDEDGNPSFNPYKIKTLESGFKIGVIGLVTQYIPNWEKPDHIEGLDFLDAHETARRYVALLREKVDYLVVLYHGGFEKDLETGAPIGRDTDENQGYKIARIPGIDLLLCGHQHLPTVHHSQTGNIVLQTGANVSDFGEVRIDIENRHDGFNFKHSGALRKNTAAEDENLLKALKPLEDRTQTYLDKPIGTTSLPMRITDPLTAREQKHPLFEWINRMQLKATGADISAASLPNNAPGFEATIHLRDIAANFVFPNTLQVLKVTGRQLKAALERTAEYFKLENGQLSVDESFLNPKEEHYNYDIYDGIDYTIDLTREKGKRLKTLTFKGIPVEDTQTFTLALNNYRAQGGGDYLMFKEAPLLKSYDISLFDLAATTLEQEKTIDFTPENNFRLKRD